ncbi:MAG TPA: hypothetical protein VGF95_03310 [Solirubrobacteraceae bacterium]
MSAAGAYLAQESSGTPLQHYATMLTLAERQLEVATSGDLGELGPLAQRWDELVALLPPNPPAAAGPLLKRAAVLNEQTNTELLHLHEALVQDISITARAGRAARGYAVQGQQGPRFTRIDRRA